MNRLALLLIINLGIIGPGRAHASPVVSFEGDIFPEADGWSRETSLYFSNRSIEQGWLVQQAEIVPQNPPNLDLSEDDFYRRSIAEFTGAEGFFLEWRVVTDGPRYGFPNVAPASIVAYGFRNVGYHFTIADDQVRLIRDNLLPLVYVDIESGVPHTYRLELYGAESYSFLIDGQVVDSGVPEGAYPTADSAIVFGGRAVHSVELTTVRWDYIRYGVIPEPATGLLLLLGASAIIVRRTQKSAHS